MTLQRIKLVLATLCLVGGLNLAVASPVFAATPFHNDACAGLTQVDSSQDCTSANANDTVTNLVKAVVDILSFIVGIVAIVMVIVAGLRYTTSGGESSKVSAAKSALLYAIIGLVVVALAQFLVHFAYGEATSGQCASNATLAAADSQCGAKN